MQATKLSAASPALAPDPRAAETERMSEILSNYPKVEDQERIELVQFLKRGNPDALAKVVYGKGLSAKAVEVKKDHPEDFGRGLRGWLPLLILLILSAAILYLGSLF